MDFKKIGIIGVGLMGGSLALAIKERFPQVSLWGYARKPSSYRRIKKLAFLDRVSTDLAEVVKNSELVVIATPVFTIIDYFKKISPFLKKGAVVIDLGSTKEKIEKEAKKILPADVYFVGCHPLCGSEKSGANYARRDLYKESLCIITSKNKKPAKFIKKFWEDLGCKVKFLSPQEHDRILSLISHLPHLISFSLTEVVPEDYFRFSLPSFKDLTRISLSKAELWRDIFLSNKKNILLDIDNFINVLKKFRKLIREGKGEELREFIEEINKKHRNLMKDGGCY